jgi:hypothetical protein
MLKLANGSALLIADDVSDDVEEVDPVLLVIEPVDMTISLHDGRLTGV